MKVGEYIELRNRTGISQAAVASAMGLTPRAISRWESLDHDKNLAPHEAQALRELFLPSLLGTEVKKIVDDAFDAIPSELVNLWLVDKDKCILIPGATHHHFMPDLTSQTAIAPLVIESLTTFPLRTGELLNLAGKDIADHPKKRFRTRSSHILTRGRCDSLLHVAAFIPSARGPQPVLMLSFENKLNEKSGVGYTEEDIIVVDDDSGIRKVYTEKDEEIAEKKAREARDTLIPKMQLMDMMDLDY